MGKGLPRGSKGNKFKFSSLSGKSPGPVMQQMGYSGKQSQIATGSSRASSSGVKYKGVSTSYC